MIHKTLDVYEKIEGIKRELLAVCFENKFPKRMKLEHMKTKKILHWVDRQGVKNDIEEMTNQHIENSLRFFFENNLWRNRKHMMKFLMMEKRRRIRFGTWNLAMARLGRFGENGRKEMANFLNEMVNI